MKKTIGYITVSLLITLTACVDNFLNEPIRGQQTLDDYFQTEESSIGFLNGAYDMVDGSTWWEIRMSRNIKGMMTDDMWSGNTSQPRPDMTGIAHFNIPAGSYYINRLWEHCYLGITRCNIITDKVPGLTFDEELKKRIIGEAKFIRAFFYFELLNTFGGVPIVKTYTELLQPDILAYTRSTEKEVYALVEQDLKDAIEVLPLRSQYAPSDLGRATKGAAQSYLAKVYLFQEKWTDAEKTAELVIASGEYALEADFANIWSVNNHFGVESIFEVDHINDAIFTDLGGSFSIMQGSRADKGWGWGTPTSDLENVFLSENDSIRLRSTIIKHGEAVFGDPDVLSFDAKPGQNKSGRINRKFYVPIAQRPEQYVNGRIPLSFIFMRYADLLLIHAEAAYFNNNPSAALSSLKEVRDRVGLETDMQLTGNSLRDAIWKERRMELALELHRFADIRRQKIDGVPRIAKIMGVNGTFVNYNLNESTDKFETNNTNENSDKGIMFDIEKHLLWPVPPTEIQLSEGRITQNPNY